MVDEKFVINLQGKKFITFEGLLNEFHTNGGKEIHTDIISTEPFIVRAEVSGEKGVFTGMGDADEKNTGPLVAKHKIRMAETRAIARALRWYNNIGMCSADELGGGEVISEPEKVIAKGQPLVKGNVCTDCKVEVSDKVAAYSAKNSGKVLCMTCQKK